MSTFSHVVGRRRSIGLRLLGVRLGWAVIALVSLVVLAASFSALVDAPSLDVLFQGPIYRLQPEIQRSMTDVGLTGDSLLRADVAVRAIGVAAFVGTGLVLALRRSDDVVATSVSAVLVLCGVAWFAPSVALPDDNPAATLADIIGTSLPFGPGFFTSLAGAGLVTLLFVFPDGRFVPRWTRWALILPAGAIAWRWTLAPDDLTTGAGPIAAEVALGAVLTVLCAVAQVHRYRHHASANQQRQTRPLLIALAVVLVSVAMLSLWRPQVGEGLSELTVVTPLIESLYDIVLVTLLSLALLFLPGSIAVSVLRYRLWDVDTLLSRTVAYAVLTGMLIAAYVAIVAVAGAVLSRDSWTIAVAATLSVAVAFEPLRRRIQEAVDRRFLRQRYDTVRTLATFSRTLHDELDLDALADRAVTAIEATLQPVTVTLWAAADELTGDERDDVGRMRRVGRRIAPEVELPADDPAELHLGPEDLARLRGAGEPVDLDPAMTEPTLARLAAIGGHLCVPLRAGGEIVGLLVMGPRRSETNYSHQDRTLLGQLGDHVAAAVRVALLVRERDADQFARHRFEEEMRLARQIQEQFLPSRLPQLAGWQFHAAYLPAREVGGDFYDLIDLPDGRLCVVAGDVTGKGVPAALVMATTHSILRSEAPRRDAPGEVLRFTNERLVDEIPQGMFVTCLVGFLDPRTGELTIANAGHNLPYLRTEDGTIEVRATGMPLGLLPGQDYEEATATVPPGSCVLLHSDGVAESHDEAGELFGFPRLLETVEHCDAPGSMVDVILDRVSAFTPDGWDQEDDITLVVLHRETRVRATAAGADDVHLAEVSARS